MGRKKKEKDPGKLLKHKVWVLAEKRKFAVHVARLEKECPTKWQKRAEELAFEAGVNLASEWADTMEYAVDKAVARIPDVYWAGVATLESDRAVVKQLVDASRKILRNITIDSPITGSPLVGPAAWQKQLLETLDRDVYWEIADATAYTNPATGETVSCGVLDLIDPWAVLYQFADGMLSEGASEVLGKIYWALMQQLAVKTSYIRNEEHYVSLWKAAEDEVLEEHYYRVVSEERKITSEL